MEEDFMVWFVFVMERKGRRREGEKQRQDRDWY